MFINIHYLTLICGKNEVRRKHSIPTMLFSHRNRMLQPLQQPIKENKPSRKQPHLRHSLRQPKVLQNLPSHSRLLRPNRPGKHKNQKRPNRLSSELSTFSKEIQRINCLNYQSSCEVLKELTKIEKLLTDTYSSYAQSSAIKAIAQEVTKYTSVNVDNFAKVFQKIAEEKERHREELVEIIYALEQTEANRLRQITPVIKYQNPDAWIRGSTIQIFSTNSTPAKLCRVI